MTTHPFPLSLDEYLGTSYQPDVDYVDGQLRERRLGTPGYTKLRNAIAAWFWHRRIRWGLHPVTEQRIQVSPSRIRICDVAVLHCHTPREGVLQTGPLLSINLLPPEESLNSETEILAELYGMGARNVWLIDPHRHAAHTFDATGLHGASPTHISVPGTPIHLDLTEPFAAISPVAAMPHSAAQ